MNATDSHDRIVRGFAELSQRLAAGDEQADVRKRIRSNTEAMEAARQRVAREYGAHGMEPPSEIALSPTALKAMGVIVPTVTAEAAE